MASLAMIGQAESSEIGHDGIGKYIWNEHHCVRNGQRRVDPLAAIFNRQNQTGKVSRQKQEYQRQGRDVNNTRQKSGSQAQVQRSKVRQSGVKHRDSRMNRKNAQKC